MSTNTPNAMNIELQSQLAEIAGMYERFHSLINETDRLKSQIDALEQERNRLALDYTSKVRGLAIQFKKSGVECLIFEHDGREYAAITDGADLNIHTVWRA